MTLDTQSSGIMGHSKNPIIFGRFRLTDLVISRPHIPDTSRSHCLRDCNRIGCISRDVGVANAATGHG